MKITLFFLPVLLLSLLSSKLLSQPKSGIVIGKVTDLKGKPIANSHISIQNTLNGSTTDEKGNFKITEVPTGKYLIQFSSMGYKTIVRKIEIIANRTIEIKFQAEEKIYQLDEVKISGVRNITGMGFLNDIHDGAIFSGKKTEVLLLDSLDANTAQNNPRQVLGRIPGANYSETEGSGFPSNGIGFRGLNPTQSIEVNTRQNGYNITADLYGYPESYYLPPLEAVERIEIIRGASSLQYGAQFGGVINYIVKKGNTEKPIEYTSIQTGGSFGMFNSFNSIGGQVGKLNYYSFVQVQTTRGWRPNSDVRKFTGHSRFEYQITGKIKLGIEYSILRNRIHMPGGFSDSLFTLGSRKSYRARNWLQSPWNILAATFEWKLSPASNLYIKSTYNSSARDLVWRNEEGGPNAMDVIDPLTNNYSNRESQHEGFLSYTTEARLISNYQFGKIKNTLATGVRYFSGNMKRQGGGEGTTGSDFDLSLVEPGYEYDLDFTTTNIAPYIENSFRPGERFSITPGLRYDYIVSSVTGKNPSYDGSGPIFFDNLTKYRNILLLGIGFQFQTTNSTNIYANWSQAYRPLDYSSLTPLGTIATVNPNLKDSKGFNSDIGFRGSVKNFLTFDIGWFYLQYNNRVGIVEKADASGKLFPFRTNIANSIHKGVESYIEFNPIKAFSTSKNLDISIFNSLAVIDARYVSGNYKGNFVEYAPPLINRVGINLSVWKLSSTFQISTTAKSYGDAANSQTPSADAVAGPIPSYTVYDWSSSLKIKSYTIKFGCNNLTDSRYFTKRTDEYPGPGIIPAIGRSIYFGIGVKF